MPDFAVAMKWHRESRLFEKRKQKDIKSVVSPVPVKAKCTHFPPCCDTLKSVVDFLIDDNLLELN